MIELRTTATALVAGDAALVDRGGSPAMVTLGSAATTAATAYATAAQGIDAREWTAVTVTQAEAEAGSATTRRAWTAQRVVQAIAAWWAGSAAATKLGGIATGATANATDAALRDRATHTGAQAIATVTGLQAALDGKAGAAHTHVAAAVTDLSEAIDDRVAALVVGGTNITLTYDDVAGSLTIDAATGGSGSTDLTYNASTRVLASSSGADVTLPLATGTDAGLMAPADFTRLGSSVVSATVATIWTGTQAAFDAIVTPDPATLYVITG